MFRSTQQPRSGNTFDDICCRSVPPPSALAPHPSHDPTAPSIPWDRPFPRCALRDGAELRPFLHLRPFLALFARSAAEIRHLFAFSRAARGFWSCDACQSIYIAVLRRFCRPTLIDNLRPNSFAFCVADGANRLCKSPRDRMHSRPKRSGWRLRSYGVFSVWRTLRCVCAAGNATDRNARAPPHNFFSR